MVRERTRFEPSPDFSLNKSTARYVLQKDPTGSRKTLQQAVRGGADRV